MHRHREAVVLRGTREETRASAEACVVALPREDVLWVGRDAPEQCRSAWGSAVRREVGGAFDAVVIDLHEGLDPEVLGLAEGMVWGGGALVLRMPRESERPPPRRELAVWPYQPRDVGSRSWDRFERGLVGASVGERALAPAPHVVRGTDEQAEVVRALEAVLRGEAPTIAVLLADRGRGKSSALGLALAAVPGARIAVSSASEAALTEIRRFAPREARIAFPSPLALARDEDEHDVVVIDEAAQLPVPLLERIARRHARARIAMATTCRGYEGTGRGFVLRFLAWAESEPRPLVTLSLSQPIRWAEGDPVERMVQRALALDAEPSVLSADDLDVRHVVLDRDVLAHDERLLRGVLGLLVHAHYRTTPGDLARILDAPNLTVHASLDAHDRVLAASLVAREGGLPRAMCEAMAQGRERIRGHVLADTLVSHLARPGAGQRAMARSVRIAVHPDARRRGVARRLVEAVHRHHGGEVELFGTVFGVTPELLRFRREVGYQLVRLGASSGSRSGEPSAVMLRAESPAAVSLVSELREDLARDLPIQLELAEAEEELVSPELRASLLEDLPSPRALEAAEVSARVARYLAGPQPSDAAAYVLWRFVTAHRDRLGALDPSARAVLESRILARRSWREVAARAQLPSVAAAMRAVRPAVAALFERAR